MTNLHSTSTLASAGATGGQPAAFLSLRAVAKAFGDQQVLRGIDLEVHQGEFLTLLGPSGCGKTTLLRIVGGFEEADSGRVLLGERELTGAPPERRPFNTVFQSYALFPHMSVAENVAYGLQATGTPAREVTERVGRMLELVHLGPLARRSVRELSGGQQQRVALARALVKEPDVLLLDEPLGALDLKLRRALQDELRAIHRRLGTTFIYVTHDQEEALTLSHRIVLMEHGRLAQIGTPREVYERPTSRFVAEFIGETNLMPAVVRDATGDEAVVRVADRYDLTLHYGGSQPLRRGDRVLAVVRPEHLTVAPPSPAALAGPVQHAVFLGTHTRQQIVLEDGTAIRFHTPAHEHLTTGDVVSVAVTPGHGVVVPYSEDGESQVVPR